MRVIVPKLRFKEFNNDYTEYKLKDIVNFYKGNTLSKSDIIENGNIKCILYGELYTKYSEIAYKIYSRTNNFSNNLFWGQTNDVLIPCSGETALDISTATCLQEDDIAIGGDLNILRPLNSDGKYLSYLICNKKRREIAKYAQGDSIVHLYGEKIKNITIYLPTINEQEKISRLLYLLDKKIELQKQKTEALKLYSESLKKQILKKVYRFVEFKDSWKEDFIENICNVQTGKSNTQDKDDNGIYPFYIRSDKIELSNKYIFDCEAVITIGDGNIGKVFFYENGKFDCHQRVYVLNNIKIYGKYLYYYFSTFFYKRAISMSAKNTVDSVRQDMITKMKIEIPFITEQIKISNLLEIVDTKMIISKNNLSNLEKYKKSLLQQMFI